MGGCGGKHKTKLSLRIDISNIWRESSCSLVQGIFNVVIREDFITFNYFNILNTIRTPIFYYRLRSCCTISSPLSLINIDNGCARRRWS